MKANLSGWVWLVATSALVAAVLPSRADVKENQFAPISERNVFGLKDPPPPPDPAANQPPPPPAATVKLTGITSLFSKKKALLEITPVGPGKQPTKPILEEGDRLDSIEIIAIDVEKNQVTIKNNGVQTNITFEVAKSTPATLPQGGIPGFNPPQVPPPATAGYVPPVPQPFVPNSVGGYPNSRGGVTVASGGSASAVPASYGPGTTTLFGNAANVGGVGGGGHIGGGGNAPTVTGGTDIRNIPSRIPRAGNEALANQPGAQAPVDPAQQYINLRASEIRAKQLNLPHPPTPPLPGVPPVP